MLVGFRLKPHELGIASAARYFCDATYVVFRLYFSSAEIQCQTMNDDFAIEI